MSLHVNTNNTSEQHSPEETDVEIREIHALIPSPNPSTAHSIGSDVSISTEGFTTMSGEFNAMVVAGRSTTTGEGTNLLGRIGEEGLLEEEPEVVNPLAIVPDMNPPVGRGEVREEEEEVSVGRVKREEAETKIGAWQTAEIAKINNRFKREDVVIGGWESAQVEKATSVLKKIERKLEEQRAKATEKMQNEVVRAHRKEEEKRATAEAKRGTKIARVLELSKLLAELIQSVPSSRTVDDCKTTCTIEVVCY